MMASVINAGKKYGIYGTYGIIAMSPINPIFFIRENIANEVWNSGFARKAQKGFSERMRDLRFFWYL